MRLILLTVFVLSLVSGNVVGEDPATSVDAISAELAEEKAAYGIAVAEATEKLVQAMDSLLEKTRNNSQLNVGQKIKLVEQMEAEREDFLEDSEKLPTAAKLKAAVQEYTRKTASARQKCSDAFDAAAKKYDRAKDLAGAKRVTEEKFTFLKGDQADELRVGTVWQGQLECQIVRDGKSSDVSFPLSLSVTERSERKFKARYECGGQVRDVSGTIAGIAVKWAAKDVKVVKGHAGFDYSGRLEQGRLIISYSGSDGPGRTESGTAILSVARKK